MDKDGVYLKDSFAGPPIVQNMKLQGLFQMDNYIKSDELPVIYREDSPTQHINYLMKPTQKCEAEITVFVKTRKSLLSNKQDFLTSQNSNKTQ